MKMLPPLKNAFLTKLEARWRENTLVCVGLDSSYSRIPACVKKPDLTYVEHVFNFNQAIVDATHDLVCAYKPNDGFYEGPEGKQALLLTVKYIQEKYPGIPIIYDCKRADIVTTDAGYADWAFGRLQSDAVTVSPYMGQEALRPFLDQEDKGVLVLAKTSNPGAGEFQDLILAQTGEPLYLEIARKVAEKWNSHGNCGLVIGATYPQELAQIREVVGDLPILIPGIGAQGGDLKATVEAGKDSQGMGMIINSSRGIIFASSGEDFGEAARKAAEQLRNQINSYR